MTQTDRHTCLKLTGTVLPSGETRDLYVYDGVVVDRPAGQATTAPTAAGSSPAWWTRTAT